MITKNEMNNIHLIVKTHLKLLLKSVKADRSSEQFYKQSIDQIEQLNLLSTNENNANKAIVIAMSLLCKALELNSNTMKFKTVQIAELIMSNIAIDAKDRMICVSYVVNMAYYAASLNDHSINAILLSIVNAIIVLYLKNYSFEGMTLYVIIDVCIDVYLKSVNDNNDDNRKYVCLTLEALINMLIVQSKWSLINDNNNIQRPQLQILTKEKWINKQQKETLSKYMEYYLDIIEFSINSLIPYNCLTKKVQKDKLISATAFKLARKQINEKGIEFGQYGFCINCRNQANFYSFTHSFPFCSTNCLNNMIQLINKSDITIAVENTAKSDLINLLSLFSYIISIEPRYTLEYSETAISHLEYYLLTIINDILSHLLIDNDPNSLIKTIKEILFPDVVIPFSLSPDYETFVVVNDIMISLIESSCRVYLKEEIGKYIKNVYLFYLQNENCSINYKRIVIETLTRLVNKSFAIEIFINYDCDMYSSNLYSELLEVITKRINGIYDKKEDINSIESNIMMSSDKKKLSIQCLDLIHQLINRLDSMVKSEQNDTQIAQSNKVIKNIESYHIVIVLENNQSQSLLVTDNHLKQNDNRTHHISNEVITKTISMKEYLKKAVEKFNINPLTALKYLKLKSIIVLEAEFNQYKHQYDNQPTTFIDSSSEDEDKPHLSIKFKNNSQYGYFQYLSKVNDDNNRDSVKDRVYAFLSLFNNENELITYDHYSAYEMGNFIHCNLSSINQLKLANFLCSSKQYNLQTLHYFVYLVSFSNYHLIEGLRLLFIKLPIIKEPQIIHHILKLFSSKYHRDNINLYQSPEQIFTIALSAFELSEEILNSSNDSVIALSDYIEKVKSMNKRNIINLTFLCDVYNNIITNPLEISFLDPKQNTLSHQGLNTINANMLTKRLTDSYDQKNVGNCELNYAINIQSEDIINFTQCSWSNYLGIFSQVITEYLNEQIIQKCINTILTVARISGILHLYTISDTFINTIINLTSINELTELQHKSIQSLRSLLSFVLANGKYISSWYLILCLLSKIDYYNSETLTQSIERKIADGLSKYIPYHLIESVYSCTMLFPCKQLNSFILALCDVVKNEIETKINRAFSLHKVIEVANFNLFREQIELEDIWRIIYESFISLIIEYKNDQVAICTNIIDSLRQIAIKFLNKKDIGNNFQLELFKPFEKIFNKALGENSSIISEMILECLISISNSSPLIIGSGWIIIFEIIKSAVRRKEINIDKVLSSVLRPFKDNLLYYSSNKNVFSSYMKCLSYFCLFEDIKTYSLNQISNTLQLLFSSKDDELLILTNIKYVLYGFNELIKTSSISYIELLFGLLNRHISLFFNKSNVWEYFYCIYFKVHLVTIILFCFVYRLDLYSKDSKHDQFNYGFKTNASEIQSNIVLYLNKSIRESIIKSNDYEYKNEIDLIANTIESMKKYDLSEYTTLLKGFIENLIALIDTAMSKHDLSLQFFIEDIIITLIELSIFNETPEALFGIIMKSLFSFNSQISTKAWSRISSITLYILLLISNPCISITETQMKDVVAYSYYFSSFYKQLLINHNKEIVLKEEEHKLHFNYCNKLITSILIIDQNRNSFKTFQLIKSQFAMETLTNISIVKTVILDKASNVLVYYDKSIINTFALLSKEFVVHSLAEVDNHPLLDVIQIELQSILPKLINVMAREDIKKVYTSIVDILATKNKSLRQFVISIIKLLIKNKLLSFTPV